MALTDTAVRYAKPSVMNHTLSDGAGLALFVCSTGCQAMTLAVLLAGQAGADLAGQLPGVHQGIADARLGGGLACKRRTSNWVVMWSRAWTNDSTHAGLRMKSTNFMGGGARNVVFRDSAIRNTVKQGFIFTLDYNDPNAKLDYTRSTIPGQFKDIRVSDVSVEQAKLAAIEVKGDSQGNAYHQGLVFERVRFSGPAKASIDGLKDSRFEEVIFTKTGGVNPWQVSNSQGLTFKEVQPAPL